MSAVADHAMRRQEAWEERRRTRLALAIRDAAEYAGFHCSKEMCAFLVRLLSQLELDKK